MTGKTLYDKLLQSHQITKFDDGSSLVLIDRVMLHERTGALALANLVADQRNIVCLLYTSPSPRDLSTSRMPSSA